MLSPHITLIDAFEARRSLWKQSIYRYYPGLVIREVASLAAVGDSLNSAPHTFVVAETDGNEGLTFALDLVTIQENATVILLGYPPQRLAPHPRLIFVDPFTEDQFSIYRTLESVFSAPAAASVPALSGSLSSLSVAEIIQIKAMQNRPTTVRIQSGLQEGFLHFGKSGLFHASFGSLLGGLAVTRMIAWTSGTFEEQPLDPDTPRTITASVDNILLNAMAALDEEISAQA